MKARAAKFGPVCTAIVLFLYAMWKIRLGIHSDEAHSIAVGDMIAGGVSFFKECWFYLQMSSVFTAPIIYIYESLVGSRTGILLLFRVISVCIQSGICWYFYVTFKERYHKGYVLAAAVLLFTFIPDFQSFTYKQELIWLTSLEIIFLYRYYISSKRKYIVFLGLMIAAGVLAYPTAILEFPVCIFVLYLLHKDMPRSKENWLKSCIIVTLTCMVCAVFFLAFIFSQISLSEFIEYFPRVFTDDNLDSSFITKLGHPIIKFAILGLATLIPIILCEKIEVIKRILQKIPVPVVTVLLVSAFAGQVYIERRGITWHCITYAYALTIFIVPYIYCLNKGKEKTLFYTFEIFAIMLVFCIALASNQGNITSMYGTLFSAVGLILILGDRDISEGVVFKEKKWIALCLTVCALSMYMFPVYEQEAVMPDLGARTIFTGRVMVQEGPAKGIAMGRETYQSYINLCETVDENVTENDLLFIIDDEYTASYGYLASRGKYATYSPQGGWGLAESDRAVGYFTENPQRMPTVVLIRSEYIDQDIDVYLAETPVGNYLNENGYAVVTDRTGYIVMRSE